METLQNSSLLMNNARGVTPDHYNNKKSLSNSRPFLADKPTTAPTQNNYLGSTKKDCDTSTTSLKNQI